MRLCDVGNGMLFPPSWYCDPPDIEAPWDYDEPWTEADEEAWQQIDLFECGYYDEADA